MIFEDKVNEVLKIDAIIQEVEASYEHIVEGIRNLASNKSPILSNHVPLQNFASGFERLVKILLLIKEKHTTGSFPEKDKGNYFSKYNNGHGIKLMIKALIEYSSKVNLMMKIPMIKNDIDYINNAPFINEFFDIISDFSYRNRYDLIDKIAHSNPLEKSNERTPFERFRGLIYSLNSDLDLTSLTEKEEEEIIIKETIIRIEKAVRALVRFFTAGFGDFGKSLYGNFLTFVFMLDERLGQLKYLEPKVDLQSTYKPLKKEDILYTDIKKLGKSKVIDSDSYLDWAFKVKSVTVYNYNGNQFTEIDSLIYALNGQASTLYKIPLYFASPQLKPRQYATFLLKEAQKL